MDSSEGGGTPLRKRGQAEVFLTLKTDIKNKSAKLIRCRAEATLVGDRLRISLPTGDTVDGAERETARGALILRRILDEGVSLAEDVIGSRSEGSSGQGQLWLLLALSRPERKRSKKRAPLKEFDVVALSVSPTREDGGGGQGLMDALREWDRMQAPPSKEEKAAEEEDFITSIDRSKELLVLLNPKSGPGKAKKIFAKSVEPVLREAGIRYKLVVTERRNHARDIIAQEQNLESYCAVLIVSGDGLLFETVQALMGREDRESARRRTALSIVAGGSGNGLARSLAHEGGRSYRNAGADWAAVGVARGRAAPLDLIRITPSGDGKEVHHAFLSFAVGFLAHVDVDSEKARWMGEPRFTLWSLMALWKLRTYRARIDYLSGRPLCSPSPSSPCPGMDCERCWATTGEEDFVMVYAVNVAYISSSAVIAPRARSDDGLIWLLMVKKGISRGRMLKFLLRMSSEGGNLTQDEAVEMVTARAVRYTPLADLDRGVLMLDGERVKYEEFLAEVLPSHLRILT